MQPLLHRDTPLVAVVPSSEVFCSSCRLPAAAVVDSTARQHNKQVFQHLQYIARSYYPCRQHEETLSSSRDARAQERAAFET